MDTEGCQQGNVAVTLRPDILLGSVTLSVLLETSGFPGSQPRLAQPVVNTQDTFRKRLLINKSTVPIA